MRNVLILTCLVLTIITASPGFADARCGGRLFGGRQPVRSFIRAVVQSKPIRSRLFGRRDEAAAAVAKAPSVQCAAPTAKYRYECNGNSCRLVPAK